MRLDGQPFAFGKVGSEGPALLCIHGLTGTPSDVLPPSGVYENLEIACVGPLLPGHGTSVEDLALTTHADWIHAVLQSYDRLVATHSRVYLLGFSLGGLLALELCALRSVPAALLMATPLDLGWLRSTLVRGFAPFVRAVPRTTRVYDPEARSGISGYRHMPLRSVLELMKLQRRVIASLPALRLPLRLIYSRADPVVRVRDAARIARAACAADVQVQYLERSGHILTRDLDRDRVAQWILEQLGELEDLHRRG